MNHAPAHFDVKELDPFRSISKRPHGNHACMKQLTEIHITTGSPGQVISTVNAAGPSKQLNQDDNLVYCLTGDRELQKNQNRKAAMEAILNAMKQARKHTGQKPTRWLLLENANGYEPRLKHS